MDAEPVKILLVDDRPANLVALESALADPGYQLVKAGSGAEALRFLLSDDVEHTVERAGRHWEWASGLKN